MISYNYVVAGSFFAGLVVAGNAAQAQSRVLAETNPFGAASNFPGIGKNREHESGRIGTGATEGTVRHPRDAECRSSFLVSAEQ